MESIESIFNFDGCRNRLFVSLLPCKIHYSNQVCCSNLVLLCWGVMRIFAFSFRTQTLLLPVWMLSLSLTLSKCINEQGSFMLFSFLEQLVLTCFVSSVMIWLRSGWKLMVNDLWLCRQYILPRRTRRRWWSVYYQIWQTSCAVYGVSTQIY